MNPKWIKLNKEFDEALQKWDKEPIKKEKMNKFKYLIPIYGMFFLGDSSIKVWKLCVILYNIPILGLFFYII